jgi:hypothetical protein
MKKKPYEQKASVNENYFPLLSSSSSSSSSFLSLRQRFYVH